MAADVAAERGFVEDVARGLVFGVIVLYDLPADLFAEDIEALGHGWLQHVHETEAGPPC